MTAYSVQQREREMAIRMAVGAAEDAVVWMFLKESALVLLVGLGAGLLGATVAGWMLQNRLYAVRAFELPRARWRPGGRPGGPACEIPWQS